jgi:hypothetical protein
MVVQCMNTALEREKALALSKVAIINAKPPLKSKETHEPIDIGKIDPNPIKHLLQAKETLYKLIDKFMSLAGEDDEDFHAICSVASQINLALEDLEEKDGN